MGRVEGSTVKEPEVRGPVLPGYARLDGVVPVESLGPGGWGWLLSRPEFEED